MRCRELEADNKILESQKKTVVVYNKQLGTFEYIGEPRLLDYGKEMTSVNDVLAEITRHLSQHSRITVSPIFYSLDKGNFGELAET